MQKERVVFSYIGTMTFANSFSYVKNHLYELDDIFIIKS